MSAEEKLKADILALSIADKFKLAAEMVDAGICPSLSRSVAHLALDDLDATIAKAEGRS